MPWRSPKKEGFERIKPQSLIKMATNGEYPHKIHHMREQKAKSLCSTSRTTTRTTTQRFSTSPTYLTEQSSQPATTYLIERSSQRALPTSPNKALNKPQSTSLDEALTLQRSTGVALFLPEFSYKVLGFLMRLQRTIYKEKL